jgi:hypothetical protein
VSSGSGLPPERGPRPVAAIPKCPGIRPVKAVQAASLRIRPVQGGSQVREWIEAQADQPEAAPEAPTEAVVPEATDPLHATFGRSLALDQGGIRLDQLLGLLGRALRRRDCPTGGRQKVSWPDAETKEGLARGAGESSGMGRLNGARLIGCVTYPKIGRWEPVRARGCRRSPGSRAEWPPGRAPTPRAHWAGYRSLRR